MALSNYQFTFGSFTIGAGTPYVILDVDGLEGLPSIRNQDDIRGFNDGMFTGRDFYDGRTLTFTMNVFAGNGNSAHQNLNLLQAALQPQQTGTTTLQFLLSPTDTEKQLNARVRSRKAIIDPEYTFGYIRSQITMFAPDPRYYDNVLQTASISPSPTISGRVYTGVSTYTVTVAPNPVTGVPLTPLYTTTQGRIYDLTYGGGTAQGVTANIVNAGWIYTSPTITVNGPATNIVVGCVEQNAAITVNTTIASTDSLVIDLNQKLVTLNGSPIRNLTAPGSLWFNAQPGNNTFYMSALNTTPGVTAGTVTWKNAYI